MLGRSWQKVFGDGWIRFLTGQMCLFSGDGVEKWYVIQRINKVTLRRARLVLGWVTVVGQVYHLTSVGLCNKPSSTSLWLW